MPYVYAMSSNHLILCCPLSFCLQSFPASGSLPMSQFFTSGGQRIGASASASVLPVNIQGWFPLVLTGLISLMSKGLSRVFSSNTVRKHQFFSTLAFFMVQLSHLYMTSGETIVLIIQTFVVKVMPLLFNTLSSFVVAFLPRNRVLNKGVFSLDSGSGQNPLQAMVKTGRQCVDQQEKHSRVELRRIPFSWDLYLHSALSVDFHHFSLSL